MAARYEGEAFRERFGPWALVAGGSDGIGEAFARESARRGLHVALVARRRAPLERVAGEIRDAYGVDTRAIALDLTRPDVADALAAETRGLDVGLLVHNAGANRVFEKVVDLPPKTCLPCCTSPAAHRCCSPTTSAGACARADAGASC